MTSTELQRLITDKLDASGLISFVEARLSQFLEFPDGLFAEVVLSDASKLTEVEAITRELREALTKRGIDLDVVVRATWKVQDIGDPRPSIGVSGGIRAAWAFPATLVSGGLRTDVQVDVTQFAIDAIKRKLVNGATGGMDEKAVMKEVVREFLNVQLSAGGESYWNPFRDDRLELNESTFAYLVGHTTVGAIGKH